MVNVSFPTEGESAQFLRLPNINLRPKLKSILSTPDKYFHRVRFHFAVPIYRIFEQFIVGKRMFGSSERRSKSCRHVFIALLSLLLSGAAYAQTTCDDLAADPDGFANGSGIRFEDINAEAAIPACTREVQQDPDNLKLQFQLARSLKRGNRVDEALAILDRLAANYPPAALALGQLYLIGSGVAPDEVNALKLVSRAADAGYAPAQLQLGLFTLRGMHVQRNPEAAFGFIERAAAQGYPSAENQLGAMLLNGIGAIKDVPRAIRMFEAAADQNDSAAQYNLAIAYRLGIGVQPSLAKTIDLLSKSAAGGFASAKNDLATYYEAGNGVPRDVAKAFDLISAAAQAGLPMAQFNLGLYYRNGKAVPADMQKALSWFAQAAAKGSASAQVEMGLAYRDGNQVERDSSKALQFFKLAAEQGSAEGEERLAFLYMPGSGREDLAQAAKWFAAASEQGRAVAQEQLGTLYLHGRGVPRSDAKAVELYRSAATQGLVAAYNDLGYAYSAGLGVDRDLNQAEIWFRKAAEAHDTFAMEALGSLNEQFIGNDKPNGLSAFIWYSLAANGGRKTALLSLSKLLQKGDLSVPSAQRRTPYLEGAHLPEAHFLAYLMQGNAFFRHRYLMHMKDRRANRVTKQGEEEFTAETIMLREPLFAQHKDLVFQALRLDASRRMSIVHDALLSAAQLGSADGMVDFALLKLTKMRSPDRQFSEVTAANWLKAAREKGSRAAMINLAKMYELGIGVEQDSVQADELYAEALSVKDDEVARIGRLRLSLQSVWNAEHSRLLENVAYQFGAPKPNDSLFVKAGNEFCELLITDSLGHRVFSDRVSHGQPFVVPNKEGLILWTRTVDDGGCFSFELGIGSKVLSLPSNFFANNVRGIRLDKNRLLAGDASVLIVANENQRRDFFVADEKTIASSLQLSAMRHSSRIYVHDDGDYFGVQVSLYPGVNVHLPDIPLVLVVGTDEQTPSEISEVRISGKGDQTHLDVSSPAGCSVEVKLSKDFLQRVGAARKVRSDCDFPDGLHDAPYIVGPDGAIVASISKRPDDSIRDWNAQGIDSTGLFARLQFLNGGQTQEALRADGIFYRKLLRKYGPYSYTTIAKGLDLAESELKVGNLVGARSRMKQLSAMLYAIETEPPRSLALRLFDVYAQVMMADGRYEEARNFEEQQLAIRQRSVRSFGEYADIYRSLALTYEKSGAPEEALVFKLRAMLLDGSWYGPAAQGINAYELLSIVELVRSAGYREVADALKPFLKQRQAAEDRMNRYATGSPDRLRVFEREFGPMESSSSEAARQMQSGRVSALLGEHDEALAKLSRAVDIYKTVYGRGNPVTNGAIALLATEELAAGRESQALSDAKSGFEDAVHFVRTRSTPEQSHLLLQETLDKITSSYLAVLYNNSVKTASDESGAEAFVVAQNAEGSAASAALDEFNERLLEDDPQMRALLRHEQDMRTKINQLDRTVVAKLSSDPRLQDRGVFREQESIRAVEHEVEQTRAALGRMRAARGKPLAQPADLGAVSFAQVQKALGADEALVLIKAMNAHTFVFVTTNAKLFWYQADIGENDIRQNVLAVRCGVDADRWVGRGADECRRAVGSSPEDGKLPFALQASSRLYQALIKPFENTIAGKELIFCLSGSLGVLPLQLLVVDGGSAPSAVKTDSFEDVRWLIQEHAISVIPSVSNLVASRAMNKARLSHREASYIGLGNPHLVGNSSCPAVTVPQSCGELYESRDRTTDHLAFRSGVVSDEIGAALNSSQAIRDMCPLPETEVELKCVLRNLKGYHTELVVGEKFTETAVKRLPLLQYSIIHFATHGLLSEETRRLGNDSDEPALVLSPPKVASSDDDGLLTASEISKLNLNADWVILSACNTAAGSVAESDALSGLATAFFFAGARSLLVSHWAVNSAATVVLINRLFNEAEKSSTVSRARALQQAMIGTMSDKRFSLPSQWAAFALIGDPRQSM